MAWTRPLSFCQDMEAWFFETYLQVRAVLRSRSAALTWNPVILRASVLVLQTTPSTSDMQPDQIEQLKKLFEFDMCVL